ncbi:hypothetical protein AGMMS49574_03790 [Bacteroidia bacterium]|nr:hypothetical protein AGMMS49574_03790 [Bacteroidia bacterium]
MKIVKTTLTILLALCAVSCKKDEVDIKYQLTINADISGVVKGYKDGNNNDIYTSTHDDLNLSAMYLIYDRNDSLVYKKTEPVNNIFIKSSISTELEKGTYTIVAWISEFINVRTWEAENENSLRTLKIVAKSRPFGGPFLGIGTTTVTIDNTRRERDVVLKAIGAFHILNFVFRPGASERNLIIAGTVMNKEYSVADEKATLLHSDNASLWDYKYAFDYDNSQNFLFNIPLFLMQTTTKSFIDWQTFDADNNRTNTGRIVLDNTLLDRLITVDVKTRESEITDRTVY